MHLRQWRWQAIVLSFLGTIVLLTTPAADEFSVCMGDFGWGHHISSSVFLVATISLAVIKIAPSSASEVEDMKNVILWERVRTGPFHWGMG